MTTPEAQKAWADKRERFKAFIESKEVAGWLIPFEVEGTKATYSSALFRYWDEYLSKTYATLWDWIVAVKADQKSDTPAIQDRWALAVKEYTKSRIGVDRVPMATASKELLGSAVKSFLKFWADKRLDYDFKIRYSVEELRKKQKRRAMSPEDTRKLYEACKTTRDRTLLLVAVTGQAPAEMIQFTGTWKEWFPKDPSKLVAPFKVELVRGKKRVSYHTTLFQDACEALRTLYAERMQKTGGQVDNLFVTDEGKPFTRAAYDLLWVHLRERAGLSNPTSTTHDRQPVSPHKVRHFFRTHGKTKGVRIDVLEYTMGHSGDKYGYDRSAVEPDWDAVVSKELGKMADILNLKTGIAQEYYASKEEELRLKSAQDTYKALFDSGLLKPEALTEPVQRRILEKIGIKPTIEIRLMADTENLPPEARMRVALFDIIAQKVGLDTETWKRYTEALKVLRDNTAQSSWENHTSWFLRCEVASDTYMKALADGFRTIDQDGKMRIMEKPKSGLGDSAPGPVSVP